MVVMNKTLRTLIGLLALITFIGCNNKKTLPVTNKSTNISEIISKVIDSVAVRLSPRNLSPINTKGRFTVKDSIRVHEKLIDYINEFRTTAIDTSLALNIPNFELIEDMFFEDKFSGFTKVYDNSRSIHIDIDKIKIKRVTNTFYFDSIVYLNPSDHIGKYRDYKNIDYRFNFSKIVYNDKKDKAAIRCQYRFEDRSPKMSLFYLEKTNNIWEIKKSYHFIF